MAQLRRATFPVIASIVGFVLLFIPLILTEIPPEHMPARAARSVLWAEGAANGNFLQATGNRICQSQIFDTNDGLVKPNQSKIFFHDGTWWMIALRSSNGDWTIWRYDGGMDWTPLYRFSQSSKSHPDAYIDVAAQKLYVFFSKNNDSEVLHFLYDAVNRDWVFQSSHNIPAVRSASGDPASFVRARNGDFWGFFAGNTQVVATRSTDGGVTWSAAIVISDTLSSSYGLTDAVAFTDTSGATGMALGVGSDTGTNARFHFYVHRDSDAPNIWSDESSHTGPLQSEQSDDHISMTVDRFNNVYMLTKTHGSGPINSLYKRSPSGAWQQFVVNSSRTWTRPAIVIDADHDSLYVLGSRTGDRLEYKRCKIGEESTLANDALVVPVLENNGDYFVNVSVPFPAVYDSTEFFLIADNSSAEDVWFARLPIGSAGPCPVPVDTTIRNLRIARVGDSAKLDWDVVDAADSFVVYRATRPMLAAADSERLVAVTLNSYTDANVFASPEAHFYYRVRAYVGGAAGPASNKTGMYEFRLLSLPGKSNNFVSLCVEDSSLQMASDLAARIGPACDLVSRWVESSQAWSSYIPGIPALDFALVTNEVYMVSVTAEDTLWLAGGVPEGYQYSLITTGGKNNNGLMLLMDKDTLKTASELAADIGNVDLVSQWNASSQAYNSYIPGTPALDFPITPGQPLMVSVTQDTLWPVR